MMTAEDPETELPVIFKLLNMIYKEKSTRSLDFWKIMEVQAINRYEHELMTKNNMKLKENVSIVLTRIYNTTHWTS